MYGSHSGDHDNNNQAGQQVSDVLRTGHGDRLEGSQSFTSPNDMSSDNDHGRTMDKPDITTQAGQGQQEPSDEQGKEKEADIEVRNTVCV